MKFTAVIGVASPSGSSGFCINGSNNVFNGFIFSEKDSKNFKRHSLFDSSLKYFPEFFIFKAMSSKRSM